MNLILYFLSTITILSIVHLTPAEALVVYFDELPDAYNIYQWDINQNNIKTDPTYKASQFGRIKFDIPDEFVERDSSGQINLTKTFENWRTGTDVGFLLPKTYAPGLARFPFTIDNGNLDRRAPSQNVYYVGAQELLRNVDKYEDLSFGSGNNEDKFYAENLGLTEKVQSISSNDIDCTGSRGAVAGWPAEKCLMCNCFNESLVEDIDGQVMIAQLVFRRVASKHFPLPGNSDTTRDNICGIISERSQFSWVGKPSKRTIAKNSNYMTNCKNGVTNAILRGPGIYDHFHTTNVRPAWASSYKERHPNSVGNHYFYRRLKTDDSGLESLNQELNASGGSQVFRPLKDVTRSRVLLDTIDMGTE